MEFLANLHTEVIHFPIAFLITYPIVELLALSTKKEFFEKSAILFLAIGVFGAVSSVLTVNQAFIAIQNLEKETFEIFEQHEIFATTTL